MNSPVVRLVALQKFPRIESEGSLLPTLCKALAEQASLENGDIVVLAQKVVSKSEGRYVVLDDVVPSEKARAVAQTCLKDPRLVQVVLNEASDIVRCRPHVLIVRHQRGYVMANAGIDQSNVPQQAGASRVLLLPEDPDASAAQIRAVLREAFGVDVAVVINDSFGRPWRIGTCGTCIGSSGLKVIADYRGTPDLYGRTMEVSQAALGDEIAAAASLVMGQGDEGTPAVVIKGLSLQGEGSSRDLVRPAAEDLFK